VIVEKHSFVRIVIFWIQEYKKEGVEDPGINFIDNQPQLELFLSKPMGMLVIEIWLA
jgi:hypothetical protein